jgi:ectoine/hydroxyectoine ABC transporter permease protein EhuC
MGKSWLDLISYLLPGAAVTFEATILCAPIALILSFLVALARRSSFRPLSVLTQAYIEIIRGTPGLLQLFYIFYALPFIGIRLLPLQAAVIGLALNYAAYGAEVFRMGFEAVPKQQIESAIALGMSPILRMRRIILPQAIRVIVPPLGNLLIELFKATALTSLITVDELVFRSQRLNIMTYQTVKIYTLIALFYFLMCYPSSRFVGWIEKKLAIP